MWHPYLCLSCQPNKEHSVKILAAKKRSKTICVCGRKTCSFRFRFRTKFNCCEAKLANEVELNTSSPHHREPLMRHLDILKFSRGAIRSRI